MTDDMSLQIYPAPILRKRAKAVESFDDSLKAKAEKMIEIMYDNHGIGLAANQAGILDRIIVADLSEEKNEPAIFVNMEIIAESKETNVSEEGCLSLPDLHEKVTRNDQVTIRYQDLDGQSHEEDLDELWARCMQHELDHLNGRLFVDLVSPIRKIGLKKHLRFFEAEYAASNS